jgi:hypothetical protein
MKGHIMTKLPSADSPVWRQLVKGEKNCNFEFLATKIFLGRVQLVRFQDCSERTASKLAGELRSIFQKNLSHPAVARDLAKLM